MGQDAKSPLDHFKMPDTPLIVAGAAGGPFCIYLSTPMRNALTTASKNSSLSFVGCYKESFTSGFLRGWVGGEYYAIAACPQFVCLGPIYHAYSSMFGAVGGIALAGITESAIVHGAEKKNAQLSINMKGGNIPVNRIQSAFHPFGNGLNIHITRNVLAMVGMRVLCDPITNVYATILGKKAGAATLLGDFSCNVVSACISMPFHQLWNYTVSTPAMWDQPRGDQLTMMRDYLKNQYLITSASGGTRLSPVIARDLMLRSAYIATIYTMFMNIERACVKFWPR